MFMEFDCSIEMPDDKKFDLIFHRQYQQQSVPVYCYVIDGNKQTLKLIGNAFTRVIESNKINFNVRIETPICYCKKPMLRNSYKATDEVVYIEDMMVSINRERVGVALSWTQKDHRIVEGLLITDKCSRKYMVKRIPEIANSLEELPSEIAKVLIANKNKCYDDATKLSREEKIVLLKRIYLELLVEDPLEGTSFDNKILDVFNDLLP